MAKTCSICNHPERADIENALLMVTPGSSITLETIAEQYEVSVDDLKMHAMFHAPLLVEFDNNQPKEAEGATSLTQKLKLREADVLAAASNEYMVTLKNMGRRLNRMIRLSDIDAEDAGKVVELTKLLTKPMVDLYLGLGAEIRQNAKAMAEMDKLLNGADDGTSSGLIALASAIRGSRTDD